MRAGLVAALLLVAGLAGAAQPVPDDVLTEIGIDQRLETQLPLDLRLVDSDGRPRQLGEFFDGRPVALNLVYFDCPMLCSLALDGALRSFRDLKLSIGKDFDVVTVSFNPQDTPVEAASRLDEMLQSYGRTEARRGWHFLTGDASSIDQLTEAVGFRYYRDPSSGEFAHASALMILTPEGRLSRYLYGVDYPARDLRLALVEASASRIGTAVDQVLLYCYQYDPVTGTYTLAVMTLLRTGGVLTLIGIGVLLFVLLRKERRPASAGLEV